MTIVEEKHLHDQTHITSFVEEIANQFSSENPFVLIFEIIAYLNNNLTQRVDNKTDVFRNRTAEQILKDGYATGCTDYTLAFLVLARSLGFTAEYVELLEINWLKGNDENIIGHVEAKVTIQGSGYFVDPTHGSISIYQPSGMVIYKMGKDSWDIGITNENWKERFYNFRGNK